MPSRGSKRPSKAAARGAIVTGGASGIGAAIARCLERDGYLVCAVDVQEDAPVKGDVREAATARKAVEWLAARGACVKALVNCAGISLGGVLPKLAQEDWDATLGVDLTAAYVFIREVAPAIVAAGGGRIVNVSSTLAIRARRGTAAYAAAKAGLIGLTKAAARDLGRDGVNVNAVAPGLVETRLTTGIPEETKQKLRDETCLGRIAEPGDVAEVVAFLCAPGSRHIAGEVIRVDGGQLS
ncbi:MAG: SDR family oxidoreductase [Planctomycetia bacterium]|nr:SDR family oxidoreductase [Planctomycetia bacterium]